MGKGPKSKKGKATRSNYRAWRGEKNKKTHKDSEARRQMYYTERRKLIKEHQLGKSDANRMMRALQKSGELPKDLIR
jgi:hypothetical protein